MKNSTVGHSKNALGFIAIVCLVAGCSSPDRQLQTTQPLPPEPTETVIETVPLSVRDIRQRLNNESMDTFELLNDAETFLLNGDELSAQALIYAIAPYLPASQHERAKTLLALTFPESKVVGFNAWLELPLSSSELDLRRRQILMQVYENQGRTLESMALQAHIAMDEPEIHHRIFTALAKYPDKELEDIATSYPSLRAHIALVNITRQFGAQSLALAQAVGQFEQVYYAHPLTQPLPPSVSLALSLPAQEVNQVAIMLPLSGRFASTGDAIKQGILAAYFALNERQDAPAITFLDTTQLSPQELLVSAENSDWVIGPLLKDNIDAVVPYLSPSTKRLALNRLDPAQYQDAKQEVLAHHTAFFGLAPEDEAIQLAKHVANSGYQHPIIVASGLGANKRMLDAFSATWKQMRAIEGAGSVLDIVQFDDIDSLDESLSSSLGVAQSEENAKQIDRMTNRILYDQTRSRQDIDAIVVFSSPEEMALINPMVEASISPFRQQSVPVYSTSRSIERSSARNTLRDLENVRFLDAPLLLRPSEWPNVTRMLSDVWPNQSANFSRLFAFGYDAFSMLPELPRLAQLPAYQYAGMSGSLHMTEQGEIVRVLPMAQIRQQKVSEITQ